MANIIPVPIFSSNYYYIAYDNNPLTKIKTVNLDISASQPSTGHVITGYTTIIAWQPTGQTATVTAGTSPFPSVVNIDASIPGTLVVLAIVGDDNPDPTKDTSYDAIFPRQNGAIPKYGRGPYAGVGPVPTQICYIVVQTPAGFSKPGKYHRDWMDMPGSYGDLVDAVDGLVTGTTPLTSGIGRFDHLYEYTAGHNIWVHDRLEIQNTSEIRLNLFSTSTTHNIINGAYDAVDPTVSMYIRSGLNYDILLRRISSVSPFATNLRVGHGYVGIYAPGKDRSEVRVDDVVPAGLNRGVHISGDGAHAYDLGADIISPETNNTGVTVRGRGAHTFDLTTDIIRADTVGNPVWINGNASPTRDLLAFRIGTNVIDEAIPLLGVRVDDVYCRNGKVASFVGGAVAGRRPHTHVLASTFVGAASTGGGVAGPPEIGYTAVIPANALASSMIRATAIYTTAGAGNKRIVINFGGTVIRDVTFAGNTTSTVNVTIARTGLNQQRCLVQILSSVLANTYVITDTTHAEAGLLQLFFAFRSDNAGGVLLQTVSVTAGDSVVAYP